MKLAGNRLRFGAALILTTLTVGATLALAPVVAAKSTPATASAERPATNTACYEQVTEYRYQRRAFTTEYQYVKETRERTGTSGQWSAWTVWDGGTTTKWSFQNLEVLEGGHHGGEHNHSTNFDRDYRYVKNGVTQQVADGTETTGWMTSPPAGDGWVQLDFKFVKGARIPCDPQPADKVEHSNWGDGQFQCGDTQVTQTRTKTVTAFVLQDYVWVAGAPQVTTETQTRALTAAEIQSCEPGDRDPSYTEWVDGTWECGDTTLTQTRTRTDYTWVNTSGSTWTQTSKQTTETQTRDLTDAEIESCQPDDREPKFTEWVDGTWECGDTTVTQTRTRTDYTWINTGGSTWELEVTPTAESRTRDLTASEKVHCNPPSKDPKVVREDIGSPECGNTMIEVKVTTTTYSYAYNEGTNSWDETKTVTATTETRDLTEDEQFPCAPAEWTPPTAEPVCGPDNDLVTVPADTQDVDFQDSAWVDGARTVTASWTYDGSELDSWTFTDANESCPETTTPTTTQPPATTQPSALDISAIGPVCLRDAPYIEVTFGNQPQFDGQPATVTFTDLDGDLAGSATATYQAGTTVRFVYPGASVDAAGNPTDWPGWLFDGDEWVQDPSDSRLRDGLTVTVTVNPSATALVTYPPATASCANPATVPAVAPQVGELPATR